MKDQHDYEEESGLTTQILMHIPANDLPTKHYSLDPDIASGWIPKLKVIGPVPLNFDNNVTDRLIEALLNEQKTSFYSVVYLGKRPMSTFKVHQELQDKHYHYKYEHLYLNNYTHLGPFFRKFYSEFQPKSKQSFRGMNPELKHQYEVMFDSDFEGGNLDAVVKVRSGEYDLFLRIDSNTRGHMQWYYFKVKNIKLHKIKLNIVNFKKNKTLYQRGMRPYVRVNGGTWSQGAQKVTFKDATLRYTFLEEDFSEYQLTMKQLSFQHEFTTMAEEVEFCYCIPYSYSRALQLCHQLSTQPWCKHSTMCQSLSGLDLPMLTITDPQVPETSKRCILVIARQHPGQSNGSIVMQGFIRKITDESQESKQLRKSVVIKVLPMMNPDGVVIGNYRTSFCGKDLNRLFKAKMTIMYPEVEGLKRCVTKLKEEFKSRFVLFLDLHGHSLRKGVFTYGPGFNLGENNYYKARVLPRLLSQLTEMFRYYSCSFRIQNSKLLTARAHICRYVPFCYTVESSNWAYYDPQRREDVSFTEKDWSLMGKRLAEGVEDFLGMYIEDQRENRAAKNMKKRRQQEDRFIINKTLRNPLSSYSATAKSLGPIKGKQSNKAENDQTVVSMRSPVVRPTKLMDEVVRLEELEAQGVQKHESVVDQPDRQESDDFNSSGADSESSDEDLDESALNKLYSAAANIRMAFENCFYKKSMPEFSSFMKNPIRKSINMKKKVKLVSVKKEPEIQLMACLKNNRLQSSVEKITPFPDLDPLFKRPSLKKKLDGSSKFLNPINEEAESPLMRSSRNIGIQLMSKVKVFGSPSMLESSSKRSTHQRLHLRERPQSYMREQNIDEFLPRNSDHIREAGSINIRIRNISRIQSKDI